LRIFKDVDEDEVKKLFLFFFDQCSYTFVGVAWCTLHRLRIVGDKEMGKESRYKGLKTGIEG